MIDLLEAHGLASTVACESRGSKDYNVGDAPDAALQAVAQELELRYAAVHQYCMLAACNRTEFLPAIHSPTIGCCPPLQNEIQACPLA